MNFAPNFPTVFTTQQNLERIHQALLRRKKRKLLIAHEKNRKKSMNGNVLRRSVSYLEKRAKCLGKRHWNIEGKSGTKENESRIEVVLFRDILGIKRYENCTIKVSGWILDGQLQNLQPSKCVSAFVSWKSCFKSASKASITLFENYPKCLIWIFKFWHFPPIFVLF